MTTDCLHYVFTTSTVPATGPRGARATSVLPAQRSSASVIEAYRRCLQWHGGIPCAAEPSLRATATLARFRPRLLATSSPQRLRAEKRVTRESNTFAASERAVRTISSPTREIPPVTSVSPDWYRFGVNPKSGPAFLDFLIRPGSSSADL